MTKFLILHGTDATPESNWFMWLKGKLIGRGNDVWLPELPGADKPNSKSYTKFIFDNKKFVIDADTVLIGHSSGAVEILRLLEELPEGVEIKAAILVSAFKDDLDWDALSGLFEAPFDFKNIQSHCKKFIFIHSDNDPYVPLEHAEYLSKEVGGELIVLQGQGHFNIELSPEYTKFPKLLDIINSVD